MPLDDSVKVFKKAALAAIEASAPAASAASEIIRIQRPRLRTAEVHIAGVPGSPYVQHAFSEKARKQMEQTQREGQQSRGKRLRVPKDFEAAVGDATHVSTEGWFGIPAPAFRNAMISACRLVGIMMTRAKLSVFVEADGIDARTGDPLVRIEGESQILESTVRLETGVADVRWRPAWYTWSAVVRVTWDEDQFSSYDIMNLMMRAGLQVGIGEGRPDSPKSNGLGWGRFEVVET